MQAGPEAGQGLRRGALGPSWMQPGEEEADETSEGWTDLSVFHMPVDRAAWSELWELTQAQGHLLQDAEVTLRVHRDLLEALTQVRV